MDVLNLFINNYILNCACNSNAKDGNAKSPLLKR